MSVMTDEQALAELVQRHRELYNGPAIVLGCNFTVMENHVCCLLIHGMPPDSY